MRELSGLGLITLSGVASAALMTWSVQDPSLSHATSRPIRNILGYAGAIGADLAMQILGLGAIMLVLTVAVWGWRMLTHRPFDREALRLGSWILCTVIAAGFVSCWPHGGAWPLPTGLGGVVGDALVRAPAVIFGPPGTIYRMVLGTILFAAMAATFLIACGLGAREHDDELAEIEDDDKPLDQDEDSDRGSVSLGWLFHALMSTKARLIWLLGAAYRSLVSSGPKTKAVAFSRHEPNLGGGRAAPSISPQSEDEHHDDDHEEEDEEEEEEEPAARAPRKKAAPKAASRKSSDKFELPSVSVLAAPKAGDRQPLSKAELEANSRALEGVLQDFRRARRHRESQSGSRRHAVRTGAGAGHQVVARDRLGRRHRPFDECAVGACRRRAGPQCHRYRAAERASRKSLFARAAGGQGNHRHGREAAALPRQDHWRRPRHHRPRTHAAHADRRHHRLGQVGRHQHHDPQPGLSAAPGPVPTDHGRSEDARTLRL
ncbi:hypothetical protein ACVW0I_008705 [Bradyrhizobium sp. LM6.11]